MLKKEKIGGTKKADREAKKAQDIAKALASQVNKNPPGGIQKSCMYNDFSNNIFEYIYNIDHHVMYTPTRCTPPKIINHQYVITKLQEAL